MNSSRRYQYQSAADRRYRYVPQESYDAIRDSTDERARSGKLLKHSSRSVVGGVVVGVADATGLSQQCSYRTQSHDAHGAPMTNASKNGRDRRTVRRSDATEDRRGTQDDFVEEWADSFLSGSANQGEGEEEQVCSSCPDRDPPYDYYDQQRRCGDGKDYFLTELQRAGSAGRHERWSPSVPRNRHEEVPVHGDDHTIGGGDGYETVRSTTTDTGSHHVDDDAYDDGYDYGCGDGAAASPPRCVCGGIALQEYSLWVTHGAHTGKKLTPTRDPDGEGDGVGGSEEGVSNEVNDDGDLDGKHSLNSRSDCTPRVVLSRLQRHPETAPDRTSTTADTAQQAVLRDLFSTPQDQQKDQPDGDEQEQETHSSLPPPAPSSIAPCDEDKQNYTYESAAGDVGTNTTSSAVRTPLLLLDGDAEVICKCVRFVIYSGVIPAPAFRHRIGFLIADAKIMYKELFDKTHTAMDSSAKCTRARGGSAARGGRGRGRGAPPATATTTGRTAADTTQIRYRHQSSLLPTSSSQGGISKDVDGLLPSTQSLLLLLQPEVPRSSQLAVMTPTRVLVHNCMNEVIKGLCTEWGTWFGQISRRHVEDTYRRFTAPVSETRGNALYRNSRGQLIRSPVSKRRAPPSPSPSRIVLSSQ